jgi:hypothetical protein
MQIEHYIILIKVALSTFSFLIGFCYLLNQIGLLYPVRVAADIMLAFYVFLLIAFVYFPKEEYKIHLYKLFGFKKILNPFADLVNLIIDPTNNMYVNLYIYLGLINIILLIFWQITKKDIIK